MRRFLIVVEKAASNFSAYSPDLPGCIATGATPEETKARMQTAITMHVQARGSTSDSGAVGNRGIRRGRVLASPYRAPTRSPTSRRYRPPPGADPLRVSLHGSYCLVRFIVMLKL
jgi:predicted RNase H-like HicB family nuclease